MMLLLRRFTLVLLFWTHLLCTLWGYALARPAHPMLQEVVVTANRRAETTYDSTASVSSRRTIDFTSLDLNRTAEILNRIPGVFLQQGSGQESLLAIRSPVLTGAGACGAFLILEDSLPIRPIGFCNINELFEINTSQAAAIEVLRGPGTAVHGANAVHGAINVISPVAAELIGFSGTASVGPHNFHSIALSLGNASESPSAAYGMWRHDGGFRADSPVEEGKINLLHERSFAKGALRIRFSGTVLNQETAGFVRGLNSYQDRASRQTNANPEAFRDAQSARATLNWIREPCPKCSDELRVSLRHSEMKFLQHFLLGKPQENNSQTSLLLSIAQSRPLPEHESIIWHFGLDAEAAQSRLLEFQANPTLEGTLAARAIRPSGRHYDYAVKAASVGAFTGFEGAIVKLWTWQVSLRTDQTNYDYDNKMQSGNTAEDGSSCGTSGCLYSRPADRQDHYRNFTPKLTLLYRPNDHDRFFTALSTGFRPPEITELYRLQRQQNVAELNSEKLRSVEFGWRHVASIWHINASIYNQIKNNVILRDANGFNIIDGRTIHRGFEYDAALTVSPTLEISSSGSLARHLYDFSQVIDGGETISRGLDIDTAPRVMQSTNLIWKPTENWHGILEIQHIGPYFADSANLQRYPGHTVAHFRSNWQMTPNLQSNIAIQNLNNRYYAERADYAQGEWRYFPARERSVFLSLMWRQPP